MLYLKRIKKVFRLKFHHLVILLLFPVASVAQEFNCTITIDDEQLEGNSFDYVKQNLTTELTSYINDYRWTEVEFEEEERIQCQINIVLLSGDQNYNFSANSVFSAKRPIYNTTSETTSLIISDENWVFSYPDGKNLIHDELQFENLTGMIDYYCYILLGYDFDSFSELGGTPYFEKAQNVVNLAQTTAAIGWDRNTNNLRNRFMLVADLVNSSYQPLRTAYYTYHRLGLDTFVSSPIQSRQQILGALTMIQDIKRRSPSNFLFDLFFDTKSREITSVFRDAESSVQLSAYNILRETDQGHLTEYDELQN